MKDPKPPHKFFDGLLDNNLDDLKQFLLNFENYLYTSNELGIPVDKQKLFNQGKSGGATQLGEYYNIFKTGNESILKLKKALALKMQEACEYYGIDFYSSKYMINGWFNVDYGSRYGNNPYNPEKTENFHDHMDGKGAPVFHGYYCINAEPSSTYYLIDRKQKFENINKNNRFIISETGHPHSIGNWDWEGPRITLAYDISPKIENYIGPNWIPLND